MADANGNGRSIQRAVRNVEAEMMAAAPMSLIAFLLAAGDYPGAHGIMVIPPGDPNRPAWSQRHQIILLVQVAPGNLPALRQRMIERTDRLADRLIIQDTVTPDGTRAGVRFIFASVAVIELIPEVEATEQNKTGLVRPDGRPILKAVQKPDLEARSEDLDLDPGTSEHPASPTPQEQEDAATGTPASTDPPA